MTILSLLFGGVVGLSLGLTGGGGAIFAVPLLVYGLGVPGYEAVGISLAAVGATAAVGFFARWRHGEVELRTGMLFALAGMVGAPIGAWLAARLPQTLLLLLFGVLMVVVAIRMWLQANRLELLLPADAVNRGEGPTCRRDPTGALLLSSHCAMLLALLGLATGVLSGLFGVGGGFVIVPALVLFSGLPIQRAIGTSLLVIALVSVSGVATHVLAGNDLTPGIAALFTLGGVSGLLLGQTLARKISGPRLQRVFALAILIVAAFVVASSLGA